LRAHAVPEPLIGRRRGVLRTNSLYERRTAASLDELIDDSFRSWGGVFFGDRRRRDRI
jgi:hypothetical protein